MVHIKRVKREDVIRDLRDMAIAWIEAKELAADEAG